MRRAGATWVALAGLSASYAATLWVMPWSDTRINDTAVLFGDGAAFLHGQLPYRDVLFEYPPLAAPVVALPGVGGTGLHAYEHGLMAMSFVLAVCVLLLVRGLARATGGDERLAMAAVAASPLLLGAAFRNHFDLAPVALTLAALLLVVRARPVAGLALLGVAAAVKGYPLVAAPVVLAWLAARGERRAGLRGGALLAAVALAAALTMVAISPSGAHEALRWQTERPVQVESTPAALLYVTGAHPRVSFSYRSDGLRAPAADWVASLVAAAGAAALALLAVGAARARDRRAVVLAALGATAAYAAFGKVLSPQYLVWTVPLMALALGWRQRALAATLAAATVLTLFEFPSRYRELTGGDPVTTGAVALRDALLVVAVALCVRALRPALKPAAPPVPR